MKRLLSTVLLQLAALCLFGQISEQQPPVTLRHITKATCAAEAPWYAFLGQTCREGVAVGIAVPSDNTAAGFLVTYHYSGGPNSAGTVSATFTQYAPVTKASMAATEWWYIDGITVTSVDVIPVSLFPGEYSKAFSDHP